MKRQCDALDNLWPIDSFCQPNVRSSCHFFHKAHRLV